MKMTEELRNISQFFLKDFTLDIDPTIYNIHHNANKEYLTHRSSAIIGGISQSSSEILEKILLANSFLDTFELIFFVGEIGLAALSALGISPGKVERSEKNIEEYATMKEFFVKLFEKSVECNCKIILPCDFVCAKKQELKDIVTSGSRPDGTNASLPVGETIKSGTGAE